MIMKRLLLICLVLCLWGEYGYAVEKQKDIEILYNRLFADKNIKSFLQIWNNVITKC